MLIHIKTHIKAGMGDIRGQCHIVWSNSLVEAAAVPHQHPLGPDGTVRPPARAKTDTHTQSYITMKVARLICTI